MFSNNAAGYCVHQVHEQKFHELQDMEEKKESDKY